eukprot:CAMPEP_0194423388 /NCGR_PEP_ID=MMETSP0176-20130528/22598_1 /TAXON_ID=216777 /ORGANISM="Proboscia alata, Strain PI-D3" /LENGTH=76 /DNA_ID=CAMNT_0039232555 /DNA_START=123 /DNA_END=350 /DNA_ORIENTATION=+
MAMDALKLTNSNGNLALNTIEPNKNEPSTMQLFWVKGILSVWDDTTNTEPINTTNETSKTDRQYILQAVNDLWDIR